MPGKFLISTPIRKFSVLTWMSKPVYYYYDNICAFLESRNLTHFSVLLARPENVLEDNKITTVEWLAPRNPSAEIQSFVSLPAEKKEELLRQLQNHVREIQMLIQQLQTSDLKDERDWAQLLTCVTNYPGEEFLFYDGTGIYISAWGIESKLSGTLKDLDVPELIPVPVLEEQPLINHPEPVESITTMPGEPVAQTPSDTKLPDVHLVADPKKDNQESAVSEDQAKAGVPPQYNYGVPPLPPKGRFPWWWLLLLLALLLLALFSFRTCAQNIPDLLPPPNVLVPVDSSKIGYDKDSISRIVTNRLNIIFKNREGLDISQFANDFKKAYPDDEYRIIYYDTLTRRVQISFPDDKMEETRKSLPSSLSQYEMIIFHENLFDNRFRPNDPGFGDVQKSWYLDRIRAYDAWEMTTGTDEIIVAVIDDGFDVTHPELRDKIVKPYNVVNRSTNVLSYRQSTHGTHVAATALGAINNNAGTGGAAPGCRLMPVQVSDDSGLLTTTAIVDGIMYAITQGADVINLSLGMKFSPGIAQLPQSSQYTLRETTMKEEEAFWNSIFEIADSYNVAVVMAGGNENIIIGLDPMQRNPSGIKVSASDSGNNRARFSNFGRYSDVSAPGKEIYSAIPGNRYVYLDGTSMASPLVAGGVALMKSLRKDLTSEKIKLILQNSGVSLNTDKPMGKLLQLDKALRMVSDSSYNNSDSCPDILNKILELERQLAELRSQCPDLSYQDTLKIPENPTSLDFFTGVWKSTTSLYNNAGKEVEVYFYIDGTADAKLRLEDPDKGGCYAGLKLQLSGREFNMNQQTPADCPGQNYEYNPYIFSCTADANGYAVCTGQNKTVRLNNFTFNLIKIK